MHKLFKDLTGMRFGRLRVLGPVQLTMDSPIKKWYCKCACGKSAVVRGDCLRQGSTSSCGCLRSELSAARKRKHNGKGTRLYAIWKGIRSRCNNPHRASYPRYGGRGVKICAEWNDFETFRKWAYENGYNDTLSIDRVDFCGDYCPENCRWVDVIVQANNKSNNHKLWYNNQMYSLGRLSAMSGVNGSTIKYRVEKLGMSTEQAMTTKEPQNRHYLEYNGERLCLSDWAKKFNISGETIRNRIQRGWSVEKALTTPTARTLKEASHAS